MLHKLAAKGNNNKRPFKPQIWQNRGRGQTEVTIRETIKVGTDYAR